MAYLCRTVRIPSPTLFEFEFSPQKPFLGKKIFYLIFTSSIFLFSTFSASYHQLCGLTPKTSKIRWATIYCTLLWIKCVQTIHGYGGPGNESPTPPSRFPQVWLLITKNKNFPSIANHRYYRTKRTPCLFEVWQENYSLLVRDCKNTKKPVN